MRDENGADHFAMSVFSFVGHISIPITSSVSLIYIKGMQTCSNNPMLEQK